MSTERSPLLAPTTDEAPSPPGVVLPKTELGEKNGMSTADFRWLMSSYISSFLLSLRLPISRAVDGCTDNIIALALRSTAGLWTLTFIASLDSTIVVRLSLLLLKEQGQKEGSERSSPFSFLSSGYPRLLHRFLLRSYAALILDRNFVSPQCMLLHSSIVRPARRKAEKARAVKVVRLSLC